MNGPVADRILLALDFTARLSDRSIKLACDPCCGFFVFETLENSLHAEEKRLMQ